MNIYTVEYYSAFKKDILPSATTWMNLGGIMLSEISQRQKEKDYMISLICEMLEVKYIEAEGRLVITRGWVGGGHGEILVKGHKVVVMEDE